MYDIMLSANSHSFTPSSPTGFLLFFFPYLIAEARNSMLNESGESWHTFLFLIVQEMISAFHH